MTLRGPGIAGAVEAIIAAAQPVRGCAYVVWHGSRYIDPEPDELCDNDAIGGTDFCELHQDEDDWDDAS